MNNELTQGSQAGTAMGRRPANVYAVLKKMMSNAGLFELQPRYCMVKIIYTLALLAAGIVSIVLFDNIWARAITAVYLAIACAQVAFLGHDTRHKQIFGSSSAWLRSIQNLSS